MMAISTSDRILFYPAAGTDWNPLYRFSHLCDTFVFCDWQATAATIEVALRYLGGRIHCEGVVEVAPQDLGRPRDLRDAPGASGRPDPRPPP
jgi:hypothetical protein